MHLKVQNRNGRQYLQVVQNYREGGKTRTRTVKSIGYADQFEDRYEDPVAHFREYVKTLNDEVSQDGGRIELAFAFDSAIEEDAPLPARLGASIALGCLDAIGVRDFFRARAGYKGSPAHAGRIFEMLATERMMHATSKREAWALRASFPRRCDFNYEDVYAALPYFAQEARHLDASLHRTWDRARGQLDTEQIFVPCGTYVFPTSGGSTHASVCVALDGEGIPLGFHGIEGRLGPESLREAVDDLKERLGSRRAVVIAGGLRTLDSVINELSGCDDGFVLFQPDYGDSTELARWIVDEKGYAKARGGVAMKSRVSQRRLSDGSSLPVKEVVLRGGGYALRQNHALIVSSETDMTASAIVQLFREIWRQAEPFQPLEADFSPMPVPVSDADHITAHFAICHAAFFALRVLRWKAGWKFNAADTADALLRMEGLHLQRNYYLFNYRSPATDAIELAAGIPLARRLRSRAELRSIPSTTCQAMRE